MSRVRSSRACFTLNNYSVEDAVAIEEFMDKGNGGIDYGIVGMEIGANGTPHLQGFFSVNLPPKTCGIQFWRNFMPGGDRCHWETAKGSNAQNKTYCSKEGPYMEIGQWDNGVQEVPKTAAEKKTIIFELAKTGKLQEALEYDGIISLQYVNQIKMLYELFRNFQKPAAMVVDLRDWQTEVIRKLTTQTDRKILFVVDKDGNQGKTFLGWYVVKNLGGWRCEGKSYGPD